MGLNPIVCIVVVLIGAKLGGIVGAIISIPVATAVTVFLSDILVKNGRRRISWRRSLVSKSKRIE